MRDPISSVMDEEPLGDEVLVTVRVNGRYNQETGQVDLALDDVRALADWYRRYCLRPTTNKLVVERTRAFK